MTESQGPVRLAAQHINQAAEVLARAFQNDPMLKYLVPDDVRRAHLLPSFFGLVVRYCLRYGEVYTTPTLEGVACWLPPGNTDPSIDRMLRVGIHISPLDFGGHKCPLMAVRSTPGFGWAAFRRYMDLAAYTDGVHKRAVPWRHWYLWALGVDPPRQGQGIGGKLVQPVLAKADADGLPCYLETENERNVRFYERYGFRVVSDGEVPGRGHPAWETGMRVWAMVRDAGRL